MQGEIRCVTVKVRGAEKVERESIYQLSLEEE